MKFTQFNPEGVACFDKACFSHFGAVSQLAFSLLYFLLFNATHEEILHKFKEDSDNGIYTLRISQTSSIACEVGGFSLARGQMSSEEKKQSVQEQGKSLTSAGFSDFVSYSFHLFSVWSGVFAFVCICILPVLSN